MESFLFLGDTTGDTRCFLLGGFFGHLITHSGVKFRADERHAFLDEDAINLKLSIASLPQNRRVAKSRVYFVEPRIDRVVEKKRKARRLAGLPST